VLAQNNKNIIFGKKPFMVENQKRFLTQMKSGNSGKLSQQTFSGNLSVSG
jgi:hypothetical protein